MEMTLKQAIDSVASQRATDEGQAVVDAMDHAVTLFKRIDEHAEQLLKYAKLTGSDRLLVEFIRRATTEALT